MAAADCAGLAPGHRLYVLFGVQGPLEQFRVPEIESVARLLDIPYSWPYTPDYTVRRSSPALLSGESVDPLPELTGELLSPTMLLTSIAAVHADRPRERRCRSETRQAARQHQARLAVLGERTLVRRHP